MLIKITRGDTRRLVGQITDKPGGSPVDITNYYIWFTVKRRIQENDGSAFIQKYIANGITITDGPGGQFVVDILNGDTSSSPAVELFEYLYDLQIKDSLNNIQTLSKGRFLVEFDVTTSI
jgi:hypothetical protein